MRMRIATRIRSIRFPASGPLTPAARLRLHRFLARVTGVPLRRSEGAGVVGEHRQRAVRPWGQRVPGRFHLPLAVKPNGCRLGILRDTAREQTREFAQVHGFGQVVVEACSLGLLDVRRRAIACECHQ